MAILPLLMIARRPGATGRLKLLALIPCAGGPLVLRRLAATTSGRPAGG
ncbi:hypothetical protein [Streptomyces sp. NPDC005336]